MYDGMYMMRKKRVKIPARTSSLIAALLCWLLFSGLIAFVSVGLLDRARLIRDNDNERILSLLLSSLWDYEDFGPAIEASDVLRESIIGLAIYRKDLSLAYSWGKVPDTFDESILEDTAPSRVGRYTLADTRGKTIKFILNTDRMAPAPPAPSSPHHRQPSSPAPPNEGPPGVQDNRMRYRRIIEGNPLANVKYLYIDLYNPAFWRTGETVKIAFPLCVAVLLLLVLYIRNLYLRNIDYRERIEAQKNLVVLGTAAGTLAHEIKNPLLSIRLQTGILRKLFSGTADGEIDIIEEEVDRLSALTYRINDYLRDAAGFPEELSPGEILADSYRRLCGREMAGTSAGTDMPRPENGSEPEGPQGTAGASGAMALAAAAALPEKALVFMDPDRLRSVLENCIRNAMESGGPPEEVVVSLSADAAWVSIEIRDRGNGIPEENMERIFDPFFTSKSTGTGIGLSISKRFVEAARGSISIQRREGGGTVVRIRLPAHTQDRGRQS